MQLSFFQERGLDLSAFHLGTLNVSVAPLSYRAVKPRFKFRHLKWHPTEPAETFSFFDVTVHRDDAPAVSGFIYFPHPETKPEHFQKPDVLELLLPWADGLSYGHIVRLEVPPEQMEFVRVEV